MTEPDHLREVRVAYDTVAVDYAEVLRDDLAGRPIDRAMLGAFAELVRAGGAGPVADLGCGPGWVTARLSALGLAAFGVDLSPEMVAVARRAHPELRFEVGSMASLAVTDGGLGGIVAWYSIIHTPAAELPAMFAGFRRALRPGGQLLLAFQVGDERIRVRRGYGHTVSLDAYRRPPELITELLGQAGLAVHACLIREPAGGEKVRQAYLMAGRESDD